MAVSITYLAHITLHGLTYYADFYPKSNSGKPFFVFWSLLAVPSLTILISNMGDTIIKWFTDLTNFIGSLTVLPSEGGFRATTRKSMETLTSSIRDSLKGFTGPGIFGDAPPEQKQKKTETTEYESKMLDRLAERLGSHVGEDEAKADKQSDENLDDLENDIRFYHYVLARECRNLQQDLSASPPKNYEWSDWEYYLKLMGNEDDPTDFPGQEQPDIMVPPAMRAPKGMHADSAADEEQESDEKEVSSSEGAADGNVASTDGNVDRKTSVARNIQARRKDRKAHRRNQSDHDSEFLLDWSWLSNASPLMSEKSEAEWILDRLSAALERELNRQRKGLRRKPPISLRDARKPSENQEGRTAETEARSKEERNLETAARSE